MKVLLQNFTVVLKIHICHANVTKSVQLDSNCPIFQICEQIRTVLREAEPESGRETKDYGLFIPHDMRKNGVWMDNTKKLSQYILKQGDTIEYKYRYRNLTIQTQDFVKKTLLVDDSWSVSELMIAICAKMGIINYEEYGLIKMPNVGSSSSPAPNSSDNLTAKLFCADKDHEKLDKLKKKLQTDDDLNWLNTGQTLRQQAVEEHEVLLLQRKYFFSEMNIDTRDPIQLGLLFIQLKEDIINGKHPVSLEDAKKLAALQCQAEFENINPSRKKLPVSLKDCVPKDYIKAKGVEKAIIKYYTDLYGKESDEAKRDYCSLCRSLKTYGITFFLVKEHVKGKSKLVPRLLGVSRDRVVRLDEKTKEILQTWSLTSIKRWAGSYNAFTMDFGDYAPKEYYTAQTNKGEQISQLISGYIDIIMKHKKAEEPQGSEYIEESSLTEVKVEPYQAEIVELRSSVSPKSIEDALKEKDLHISLVSPTDEVAQVLSNADSSVGGDFTMVTPIPSEETNSKLKADNNDFVHVTLVSGAAEFIDEDVDYNQNLFFNSNTNIAGDSATVIPMIDDSTISYHGTTTRTVTKQQKVKANSIGGKMNQQEKFRANRNYSPDSFMTGGTIICHTVRQFSKAQKQFMQNINQDLEKLKQNRIQLDHTITTSKEPENVEEVNIENVRTISKEHAIQNLGSMNTEVVQVLRSSKDAPLIGSLDDTDELQSSETAMSKLKDIERSFKIITVHFPSFIQNVRTIAEMNNDLSVADDSNEIVNGAAVSAVAVAAGGGVTGGAGCGGQSTGDDVTDIRTSAEDSTVTAASAATMRQENLIDAARKLADAFSGMLNAVKPQEERKEIDLRKAILDAANKVGEASSELFRQITSPERGQNGLSETADGKSGSRLGRLLHNSDHDYEDSLIYLVRAVANETARLVQIVKNVTQIETQEVELIGCQRLVGPVTHAGLATSQLVTCVKILAPTINQASCTNQVLAEISDVKESINNVERTYQDIVSRCSSYNASILTESDLTSAIDNVRVGITRLEEHLQCGISVINFAPRIQSLEAYLHSYQRLKSLINNAIITNRRLNDYQEVCELADMFLQIGLQVIDDVQSLKDSDHKDQVELQNVEKLFMNYHLQLSQICQSISSPDDGTILAKFHFLLDCMTCCILYEGVTRYVVHDQLIHNLYRSAQILLTTCHKLIISYREVVRQDSSEPQLNPECCHVMEKSESLLLIMNKIKSEPDNERLLVHFIRDSINLVYSCSNFCAIINKVIPNGSDFILVDILVNAVSQTLAQCEYIDSCLDTVEPIKSHLELVSILGMLESNQLASLTTYFKPKNQSRISVSQTIKISIAILEKIQHNTQLSMYPHYHTIFELIHDNNNLDSCLIVNLYHSVLKMKESINYQDLLHKFKNVVVLLYRLIVHADSMLLNHGLKELSSYPLGKCIEELMSTLSSLQARSENIFAKFKTTIINKQNWFKSMLVSGDIATKSLEKNSRTICAIESSINSIKEFKEALDSCRSNFRAANFHQYVDDLYQGYLNVTKFCEDTLQQTGFLKIIDDFIMFSLSILNLVQEQENLMVYQSDSQTEKRIDSKTRTVYDISTRLLQTLTEAMKRSFGAFSDSLMKLQITKDKLSKGPTKYSGCWDRKSFSRILCEQEMVKTNCDILKEIIEEKKPIAFDNQLFYIAESISEICISAHENFPTYGDREKVLGQVIDLAVALINCTINIIRSEPQNNIDLTSFETSKSELEDALNFLINSLRHQIPGYRECCRGLTEVTQLTHDLNETEVSIASEKSTRQSQSDITETNYKICSTRLYKMGISISQIEGCLSREDLCCIESLPSSLNEATACLRNLVEIAVRSVISDSLSDRLKIVTKFTNDLVDCYDKFLQVLNTSFLTVETDQFVKPDKEIADLIQTILTSLKFVDENLYQDLLRNIDSISYVDASLTSQSLHNNNDETTTATKAETAAAAINNDDLANTVSGMIADDDTTILFASAGIRNNGHKKTSSSKLLGKFSGYGEPTQDLIPLANKTAEDDMTNIDSAEFRNLIQKAADALLVDTKSLVENSNDQQKSLAENTESVIKTIFNLTEEYNPNVTQKNTENKKKMLESIESVKSTLQTIYPENADDCSKLTISNCEYLLSDQKSENKSILAEDAAAAAASKAMTTSNSSEGDFASSKKAIEDRMNNFAKFTSENIKDSYNGSIDRTMERIVSQASGVLALCSELMRMPLNQLLQADYQNGGNQSRSAIRSRDSVAINISTQCLQTLFEYLDSLEELSSCFKSSSTRQNIFELGTQVSRQFIKLFDVLDEIKSSPLNQYHKSSMLDIFYMVQDSIKNLLDFSSQINKSSTEMSSVKFRPRPQQQQQQQQQNQKSTNSRRVSFREKSNSPDQYDNKGPNDKSINTDSLMSIKQGINELEKLQSDASTQSRVEYRELIEHLLQLAKSSSDLIGLTRQCCANNEDCDKTSEFNYSEEIINSVSHDVDQIKFNIKNCLITKSSNPEDQTTNQFLKEIITFAQHIDQSGQLLIDFYQKTKVPITWKHLLQNVTGRVSQNVSKIINVIAVF